MAKGASTRKRVKRLEKRVKALSNPTKTSKKHEESKVGHHSESAPV